MVFLQIVAQGEVSLGVFVGLAASEVYGTMVHYVLADVLAGMVDDVVNHVLTVEMTEVTRFEMRKRNLPCSNNFPNSCPGLTAYCYINIYIISQQFTNVRARIHAHTHYTHTHTTRALYIITHAHEYA